MSDIQSLAKSCDKELADVFAEIDEVSRINTERVLEAFAEYKLSERHFAPSTGYGYGDDGRDVCEKIFARVFGCEAGIARHIIISGTHAISIGLYGLLRPGDTMLSVTGEPYDTLEPVIGIGSKLPGSLADYGIKFKQIPFKADGKLDFDGIEKELKTDKSIRMVYAQRSKGYAARRTLTIKEFEELYAFSKKLSDAFVVVDNCYGEFCDVSEPKADLVIGSLIKNAGGGIAECGGYLVGSEEAVKLASYRLTVPGVGLEAGASLGQTKNMLKGLFLAPHVVAQALKTAHFASLLFEKLGFEVMPKPLEKRSCIIQTVELKCEEKLLAFCKGLQSGSPVDSYVVPCGWRMPGYDSDVVMAAGAFTQGSSIELSADAPVAPPYRVYMQGGMTYESGRYGIIKAAEEVLK